MWKISYILFLITIFCINLRSSIANSRDEDCDLRQIKTNTTSECRFKEHDRRLVCFHGVEDEWESGDENVRTLILCYWPKETFDPENVLKGYSRLKKLAIKRSNFTKLITPFPNETLIESLEITETNLWELPRNAFINLSHLKTLDFRNNSLSEVDVETFNVPTLRHIYLSGNPLKCTSDTKWILDQERGSLGRKISDKDHLRCTAPYMGRPLIPVVEIIKTLKEECSKTICECELVYVLSHRGKHVQRQMMAFISVNCSHRGLVEMPDFLPANTTTLHLSGNKIQDLRPLITNPAYRDVVDIYLDDNMIESIVQLEGSNWMDHFRVLSLRGNKLTDLPTYALENVLQRNGNAVSLYLSRNSWRCDCLFTPGFQDLLIRYTNLIKDVNEVICSSANGDDNSGKIIRDLKRTEICVSSDEEFVIHPLDILNVFLAFLIFLIIGKLLYDYWCFRKTGKLPWIVTKIP